MEEYSHDLEKNLEALEMELHALNAMRNDLLKRVEKEEDRGLQVLPEVKGWASMVEEIEPKARRLLDKSISQLQKLSKYDDVSKIPPPTQHYSETVCMTLEEVETHKSKGVFKELIERAPLSHLKKMKPLQKIASREMLLDKVWKCLAENESRTLGFYGMTGVGKTTLLTQVKNKFIEVGDVYSLVIFVVVKSEEVERLQDEIREKLGLHGGQGNKEEKASEIFKFLSRKRFVLLLDGLQRKVDLEEIGVPLPDRENGCKIVFTTHSQEACGSQWIDAVEEVKCLSTEESWDFFQKTVGETTLKSHPDIPQLARIVARKCGGLPIALKLIGRTMSHKRTIREWHRAIHVLVSSIPEFSERKEVSVLKFTYDNLSDDNMKMCFLYCALFPRNSDLSKQDLVDCWIGEGIIDEEDREIAEIKGYEMVGDLVRMGLLTENESGYGVKMHDMVLEMALWVAAQASDSGWFEEHFVVKWGERIHQMPTVNDWNLVRRMSVTSTQIETISGSPPCSKLRTLFLQGNGNLKRISGDFFRWMTSLAVLNLSCNRVLSELPEEVSSLVSLQFLNLSGTWINRLPLGLKELKSLIHLDLDYTYNLKEIEVIASLLYLQVLRLFWSVPINLGLMEDIQRLQSLKELSLTVVEDSVFVRLLSSHRLRSCIRRLRLKYTTITDGVIALLNAMFSVRELDIFGCNIPESTIDWRSTIQRETVLSGNAQMIPQFWNLRTVCLYECNGLRDLTWLLAAAILDDLTLCKCPHTERVISKEKAKAQLGHTTMQPFQNLTRLSLNDLPKLESIYWTPLPFPFLEDIIISRCPKLKILPFNSESAIGNQLRLDLDDEWIKGVEWEDEATKQRFSGFNNRGKQIMAEEESVDGLASELYLTPNKVLVGTTESGESATTTTGGSHEEGMRGRPQIATSPAPQQLPALSPLPTLLPLSMLSPPPRTQDCSDEKGSERRKTTTNELELGSSAVGGTVVSVYMKLVIEEAKKVKGSLTSDLISTMETLIPFTEKMEEIQGLEELKNLTGIIKKTQIVIHKCQKGFSWFEKYRLTKEIEGINKDLLKFYRIDLQLLLHKNPLQSFRLMGNTVNSIDGLSKKLDQLSISAPGSRDLCSVPKLDMVPVGLDRPLLELKKKFLNDGVDRLVVSAPPGCGKTTLVTQLCHDAQIKRDFKHILFIAVSSAPNFRVMVQNLIQLNAHGPLTTYEDDSQATIGLRSQLEKLIQDGPILLVLDDVWSGQESLLHKFRIGIPNYKILVTSRSEFPIFGYTYQLEPLKDEDAKALLVECASRPAHASQAEYEDLLQKILKHCKGFPLMIKVVGASLKNRSLASWKSQVISWSKGGDNFRPTLLDCLQPSLDALDSNLKRCFSDIGSFLENQKIRASVIIDIWVELYGNYIPCATEKEKSIQCMQYLKDLATHNLLDLVSLGKEEHENGFYNEFLVTQHAILRELAISQSLSEPILERQRLNLEIRGNIFPDWCLNPVHPVINASLLSISTDDLFSSSWVEINCPNVEALVLNLSSSDYALPSFIVEMKKLRVLSITNHGFNSARLSSFSCLRSLPSLKRIRLEKVSVDLVNILQFQHGNLEKLSLVMCHFLNVSHEISVAKPPQTLQEIDIDYGYDLVELPFWFSEIGSLKTLSITNCNKLTKLPDDIGNLSKLEVLRLNSCINLSELPETTARLNNLQFLDISDCLGLRKLPLEFGKLKKLKKISMSMCWKCELPDSVKNLEDLEVECDEKTGYLWKPLKPKMKNLKVGEEGTDRN